MLKDYARNGADWAKDALSLRPCELWQEIKGRTVWFAGDSVSQVRSIRNELQIIGFSTDNTGEDFLLRE